MARRLASIPRPTSLVPKPIADILGPIRDAIETRFLGRDRKERAITGSDLVKLGLATDAELQALED